MGEFPCLGGARDWLKFCVEFSDAFGGTFNPGDVEFVHRHHGCCDPGGYVGIRIVHQFDKADRGDLPEKAKSVFYPSTLSGFPIFGKAVPVIINFCLVIAGYGEGNSFVRVTESRMYRVVETPEYGGHEVKLSSNSSK